MQLDKAIKLKLLSIKVTGRYSEDLIPLLRQDFMEMFVAGFEEGRDDKAQELNHHSRKTIVQYNLDGKPVNTFKSLKEACKKTGFSKSGILHSIQHNSPTRQKWLWKYLNEKPLPKV